MKYTIAQAAQQMRLTPYTLRYYDREGLLPAIARDEKGNRLFTEADLDTLSIICCLRNTGMPIRDIRRFMCWKQKGNSTLHERCTMLLKHRETVLAEMEKLTQNLQTLQKKLDYFEEACSAYDKGEPIPCCTVSHTKK